MKIRSKLANIEMKIRSDSQGPNKIKVRIDHGPNQIKVQIDHVEITFS